MSHYLLNSSMKVLLPILALLMIDVSSVRATEIVRLDFGKKETRAALGFGWSNDERGPKRDYIWMEHLEADLWVELEDRDARTLIMELVPQYVGWRKQSIGIYINDKFVNELVCPLVYDYITMETIIPENAFRKGKNKITFRCGFKRKPHTTKDQRELALAVDWLELRPVSMSTK